MSEQLHLDNLIEIPPTIIRTNKNGPGAMNKHGLFATKKERQRGVQPGGRRRKKSRKKKKRKRARGRSGKKKSRKTTATVHKFEIVKRNPLTVKIFERQGKKWVLIDTHVSQKGGTRKKYDTRQSIAAANFARIKHREEGMAPGKIKEEWRNILRENKWSDWINPQTTTSQSATSQSANADSQSAGKRKTKRKKRRKRKKTRRQFGCNKY